LSEKKTGPNSERLTIPLVYDVKPVREQDISVYDPPESFPELKLLSAESVKIFEDYGLDRDLRNTKKD
jgi:hypothetical protein